jgi:hypothetical protein
VSWWMWAIVAWVVVSVPFAVCTAKFIAAGREYPGRHIPETGPDGLIDLVALEQAEAAEAAMVPEPGA